MENKIDIENQWLLQLQLGDKKAFCFLFDHYHQLLYALAYRYLKSSEEAEDAVQYTFMKVWEKHASIDFTEGAKNLLFTILKNHILNRLRHKQVINKKEEDIRQRFNEVDNSLIENLEKQELYTHLNEAITLLPHQKREICLLKIKEDLTNQEIADKMNITVSTVKAHYNQLLKILRVNITKFIS